MSRSAAARAACLGLTVALLASGLGVGQEPDPCASTSGAAGLGARVCWQGRTAAVAEGPVSAVEGGAHAGTAFVSFDVEGLGRLALVGDGAGWLGPLPAGRELRLRTPALAPAPAGEGFVLAQLATPMVPAWAAALAEAGATVHAYVPDNAFLLRASEASAVAALPFVVRVAALAPDAKVEPGLAAEGGAPLVNVLAVPGAPGAMDRVRAALGQLGAEVHAEVAPLERFTARLPAERLPALAAVPEVLWVDRAGETFENDMNNIRVATGAEAVQLPLPGGPFDGTGVAGMVMDSGLETGHADFQDCFLGVDGTNSAQSHGTAVFGIVCGSGAAMPAAKGMAPGADVAFAWYSSGLSRYQHAANGKAKWDITFHTNSWGRGVPLDNTYDSYSRENDLVVFNLDVLMLQSMSNYGPLNARREAMAKNILSIGGLRHGDNVPMADDLWLSGASTGPAADGRIKPELAGPYDFILTTTIGGSYTPTFGGTSGATPVNAGAVAIVNQMARAGLFGAAGTPSPAAVKALMVGSAQPWLPHNLAPALDTDNLLGRDIQGWGLPNLAGLYAAAPSVALVDETAPLRTGEAATFAYTPPLGAAQLKVSLVWTDVPANPGAGKTLVNDLDLEVRSPSGAVYHGNVGLRSSLWSAEGGTADRLNNLENVFLPAPEPGTWTVTVRAAAVNLDGSPATPGADQPFALAILAPLA